MKLYFQEEGAYPPPPSLRYGKNTLIPVGGVSSLYPDYLESPFSFVCPKDPWVRKIPREVRGQAVYSSYDLMFNSYGYDPLVPPGQVAPLRDPQSPGYQALLAAWRKSGLKPENYPMLSNSTAPDHTIITLCPWHKKFLVLRVNGSVESVRKDKLDLTFQKLDPIP